MKNNKQDASVFIGFFLTLTSIPLPACSAVMAQTIYRTAVPGAITGLPINTASQHSGGILLSPTAKLGLSGSLALPQSWIMQHPGAAAAAPVAVRESEVLVSQIAAVTAAGPIAAVPAMSAPMQESLAADPGQALPSAAATTAQRVSLVDNLLSAMSQTSFGQIADGSLTRPDALGSMTPGGSAAEARPSPSPAQVVEIAGRMYFHADTNRLIEEYFTSHEASLTWSEAEVLLAGLKPVDGTDAQYSLRKTSSRIVERFFHSNLAKLGAAQAAAIAGRMYFHADTNRLIEEYFKSHEASLTWSEVEVLLAGLKPVDDADAQYSLRKTSSRIVEKFFHSNLAKLGAAQAAAIAGRMYFHADTNRLIEEYFKSHEASLTWGEVEVLLAGLKPTDDADAQYSRRKTSSRIVERFFHSNLAKLGAAQAAEIAGRMHFHADTNRLIEEYFKSHEASLTWSEVEVLLAGLKPVDDADAQYSLRKTQARIIEAHMKAHSASTAVIAG